VVHDALQNRPLGTTQSARTGQVAKLRRAEVSRFEAGNSSRMTALTPRVSGRSLSHGRSSAPVPDRSTANPGVNCCFQAAESRRASCPSDNRTTKRGDQLIARFMHVRSARPSSH